MELQEIIKLIDAHVREEYDIVDDPDYATDINLFDYGYIDSLSAVELITFIETRFDCTITQRDISKYPMNSVEEIAEVVSEKLAGKE